MKKLLSVVLSALLLMTSVLCVSAEKSAADVKVSTVAFDVKVEVTTDAIGRMTAILKNKDNTVWFDMDQTDDYDAVEGVYVYTFDFVLPSATETGAYTVTVGGCVEETAVDFNFTNINTVISFYNTLDDADAEEIHNLLSGEDYVLSYNLTAYKALDDDICDFVDAEIASWDLATDLDNITAIETFFAEAMDDVIDRAVIADGNTETEVWEKSIADCVKSDVLKTDFMDKVEAEVVHDYFKKATLKGITADDIQVALDEAQLLAVADEMDYASLNDAFDFYLEKGIVSIKEANYNEVVKANKADQLFKAVKEMSNTTISDLESNVNEAAEDILAELDDEEDEEVKRPTSSGGGGGGGVGGGSSNRKNTTGNTMMSGDAAESTKKPEEVVYNSDFADLGEAAWAATAIKALAEKGIISGRGDGNFYPNDTVTREEFVKIIVMAFDALDEKATASFDDVAEDRWSYKYIATANRLGLVTGLDEHTFNPTGTITREDMAVIMHRAMKLAKLEDGAYSLDFADSDEIADYAKEAVAQLAGKNIINGMGDNMFAPKGTVTRAQAAKVVYELLALIGGVN